MCLPPDMIVLTWMQLFVANLHFKWHATPCFCLLVLRLPAYTLCLSRVQLTQSWHLHVVTALAVYSLLLGLRGQEGILADCPCIDHVGDPV